MLTRRYGVALGIAIALLALVPTTARPAQDAQGREPTQARSYPDSWPEIKALNKWNPVPPSVPLPDGTYWDRSWRDMFGGFCYQTLVDPGAARALGGIVSPVSRELHDRFKALAAACIGDPAFGGAMKLLFENVDAFVRDLPLSSVGPAKTGPLSREERARLREVAQAMRQVMASDTTKLEIKAAAHLIAALTEDREVTRDAVNTRELARIAELYPKQPLTGFVSLYYLQWVLDRRGRHVEARRVANLALYKYPDYLQVRDLEAYRELRWQAPRY
jgi:hypothetical protein